MKLTVALSIFFVGCTALVVNQTKNKFPDDFIFGTATASYQIEGAWDADGKSESIWDHMTHNTPYFIKDQSNGDIASDSYNNYKRDVEIMRELGLDAYRFSLSWSRILPSGFPDRINPAGVDFYNNYINEMLKYNIQPMVTLYHWDLPQSLQDLGGFANPLIIEWFEDYARVAFELFGDRVKYWFTFNEPKQICYMGYGSNLVAPQVNATGSGTYICTKNLLLAHAKTYYAYINDFKPKQDGLCGIAIDVQWFASETDSEEDEFAAELKRQREWGLYVEPIFSEKGGFPQDLEKRVAEKSAQQGFPRSRMPQFTDEERDLVKGSYDFFGLNHYTSYLISATKYLTENIVPSIEDDVDVGSYQPDEWLRSASSWLALAPKSLYNTLTYLSKKYNYPPIIITENGWSTTTGLDDDERIKYYKSNLQDALDALNEGVQLKAYMAWSLMDNFEWTNGYTERFGLYEVDYEDPARTRTARKSAFFYKHVVKTRNVDHDYEPDNMVMTIDEGH